jgi:hypothetical protein
VKVYIAGPINGYENLNKDAFQLAASKLIELGHEPVNPHDIGPLKHDGIPCAGAPANGGHSYGCYMIPDLKALLDCDGYTLLNGWERSKGAFVEDMVANICGLILLEL